MDIIHTPERVFPVGRLDKDTTGLILLTNDGRITNLLTHPKYQHEKEYVVETFGAIDDEALNIMRKGVFILGRYTKKCKITRVSSGTFKIILTEGRNRQIRRMVEAVGKKVKKLKRIRVENIHLDSMKEGQLSQLTKKEQQVLFDRINLESLAD